MIYLNRMPIWSWFLLITIGLYSLYNPTEYSIFNMWLSINSADFLPFKILVTLILTVLLGLIVHGTWRAIGMIGLLIMILLIVVMLWAATTVVSFDITNPFIWQWLIQPIVGLILTVGWQWPKIWRATTGTVIVSDPDANHDHHNENN